MEYFAIVWVGTMFLSMWLMVKQADRKDVEIMQWKLLAAEASHWKLKYSKVKLLNVVKESDNG